MRVIISGCLGRMGTVLTSLIEESENVSVVAGIDVSDGSYSYPLFPSLKECDVEADVVVDFSLPSALKPLVEECVKRSLAVVIATTGLSHDHFELIEQSSKSIPIFRSQNMSLGINLLQQLLRVMLPVIGDSFDIEIIEKHHNNKRDAPSGTAYMLADTIKEASQTDRRYTYGRVGSDALREKGEIGIHAVRGGTIVGEHQVLFAGRDEVITLTHQAYSRQVFATGALRAALFLRSQKPGLYCMSDLIKQVITK